MMAAMKTRKLTALAVLLASSAAWAARATWTGNVEYITTVTYKQGVRCEYNLYGQTFWKTFIRSSCPYSIEVE